MTNNDEKLSLAFRYKNCQKCCESAQADFDKLAADAEQVVKDSAQKQVDRYCGSGADQERIRNTKEKSQRLNKASKLGLHGWRRPSLNNALVHPLTNIWAQTIHHIDVFGRWTLIIILRQINGQIFQHEPSITQDNNFKVDESFGETRWERSRCYRVSA